MNDDRLDAGLQDIKQAQEEALFRHCPDCKHRMATEDFCSNEDCDNACPHDELDHGICLECGKDCFDDLVAKADFLKDE